MLLDTISDIPQDMACVTLKRSIDLSFHGDMDTNCSSHKRSRCSSVAGLAPWRSAAEKRRRRILRLRQDAADTCESIRQTPDYLHLFPQSDSTQSGEFVRSNLQDEAKRLKHRNQLSVCPPTPLTVPTSAPLSGLSHSPLTNINSPSSVSSRDQPLFTLRQVETICSRMLQENEEQLREQYGQALSERLSEQYDDFLKFTHDHIQKQFSNTTCSYIM